MVVTHVVKYWEMAGYKDMLMMKQNIGKKVMKELSKYQTINKSRGRNSPAEIEKRQAYLNTLLKLFDIASPDIEDKLKKSRILAIDDDCPRYRAKEGYTRKVEDISFLVDQRGDRKMVMGEKDNSYERRVDNNTIKKQQGEGSSKAGSSSNDAVAD